MGETYIRGEDGRGFSLQVRRGDEAKPQAVVGRGRHPCAHSALQRMNLHTHSQMHPASDYWASIIQQVAIFLLELHVCDARTLTAHSEPSSPSRFRHVDGEGLAALCSLRDVLSCHLGQVTHALRCHLAQLLQAPFSLLLGCLPGSRILAGSCEHLKV